MSTMTGSIFRPGRGQTINSYTSAVAQEAMFPHDFVQMATEVPASAQGSSGVFEGKQLLTYDYIEVELLNTGNIGCGMLCVGVVMGAAIDSVSNVLDVSVNVGGSGASGILADGDVIAIQRYGVHPCVAQITGGLIADYLHPSSTDGEATNSATAVAMDAYAEFPIGANLIASFTYTRAASVTNDGATAFVKC